MNISLGRIFFSVLLLNVNCVHDLFLGVRYRMDYMLQNLCIWFFIPNVLCFLFNLGEVIYKGLIMSMHNSILRFKWCESNETFLKYFNLIYVYYIHKHKILNYIILWVVYLLRHFYMCGEVSVFCSKYLFC